MGHLGWIRTRAREAPPDCPLEDLNELYCRTKMAEARAGECGFAGTAAALAGIAAAMAEEPGIDHGLIDQMMRPASAVSAVSS